MITLKLTAHCSGDDCGETEELDVDVTILPFKVDYTECAGITGINGVDDKQVALPGGWEWMTEHGDSWEYYKAELFCPACAPAKREAQRAANAAREKRYADEHRSRRKVKK